MSAQPERLCGLDKAAAMVTLATTIYYARCLVYGLDHQHWDALAHAEKRHYVAHAEALLETLRPAAPSEPLFDLAVNLARAEAAHVIGRITPEMPYGVDPRD